MVFAKRAGQMGQYQSRVPQAGQPQIAPRTLTTTDPVKNQGNPDVGTGFTYRRPHLDVDVVIREPHVQRSADQGPARLRNGGQADRRRPREGVKDTVFPPLQGGSGHPGDRPQQGIEVERQRCIEVKGGATHPLDGVPLMNRDCGGVEVSERSGYDGGLSM